MTTYAVLRSGPRKTTFHERERRFASELCDQTLFLTTNGLDADPGDEDPVETSPTELANAAYASVRDLDWVETDDVYVLIEPALLDRETGNQFRRTLRVVFERVEPVEHFPYDRLERADRRAGWLTASLEDGEIRDPASIRRTNVTGVAEGQRDLFFF